MTPPKKAVAEPSAQTSPRTTATAAASSQRRPWKKKTVFESIAGQVEKMRADVVKKEEELKQAKQQLQKLDEALKGLEPN